MAEVDIKSPYDLFGVLEENFFLSVIGTEDILELIDIKSTSKDLDNR